MSRKIQIRILSFFLAAVQLLALLPSFVNFSTVHAARTELKITVDGNSVQSLILEPDEKTELEAVGLSGAASYQWQIRIPEQNVWVNIADKQSGFCELSLALVESILNPLQRTAIRCTAEQDGELYFSDPVSVVRNSVRELERSDSSGNSIPLKKAPLRAPASGEFVTVQINYLLNNQPIFDPYIASLQYGTSFSANIPSPTFMGYAPFISVDGVEVSADSVSFSYVNLTESQELNVYYKPVLSEYTVRYYFQNVSDDLYVENPALLDKGEALTGSYPDLIDKDFDGFTVLFHEPDRVAADGSTEFHVYYDRTYYLYTFDLNGGYGVDPVYARYETPLVVGTPTLAGYVFQGWDKQEADGTYDGKPDALPASVGASNATYKAIWVSADTHYSVVFWNELADDEKTPSKQYAYWARIDDVAAKSGDLISWDQIQEYAKSVPGVSEQMVRHFEFAEKYTREVFDTLSLRAEDGTVLGIQVNGTGSTVINIYFTRKSYTLRFYYARSYEDDSKKTHYEVDAATTYGFGTYGSDTNDIKTLLENTDLGAKVTRNHSNWGEISGLPTFNTEGENRISSGIYRMGSETISHQIIPNYNNPYTTTTRTFTYYYFEFTEKYGNSLNGLWPIGVFEESESTSPYPGHKKYAVFSAWNGEYRVEYSKNSNQTIKGNYLRLDDALLYSLEYKEAYVKDANGNCMVRYLAFWENAVTQCNWGIAGKWTYNIYREALKRELSDPSLQDKLIWQNETAYLLYQSYVCCDNNQTISSQTPPGTQGFYLEGTTSERGTLTAEESQIYEFSMIGNFYYKRNLYTIRFFNNGEYLTESGRQIRYQRQLTLELKDLLSGMPGWGGDGLTPPYPKNLEKDAYTFDGWYTSDRFLPGTEVTDATLMLATDMTLYAHWVPIQHTVTFSQNYDEMMAGNYLNGELSVAHQGYILSSDIPKAENGSSVFIGWFYIDADGSRRAFDPGQMPIVTDLSLYAEWQSGEIVSYRVRYVTEDGQTVSPDLTGYTYAETTKTFSARTGADLYPEFQEGFFPTVASSSILAKSDSENEVTFVYVKLDSVPYTVRYIDRATGEPLDKEENFSTKSSVITLQARYFSGYVTDSLYKRCTLTADEDQNIFTFYYTKDTSHLRYAIRYFTEDLTGGGYTEYQSIEHIGDVNSEISVPILDLVGFTYSETKTKQMNPDSRVTVANGGVNAKLTENGTSLVVDLYYTRNSASYRVRFAEYGNREHVLASDSVLNGKFGETVSYTAPESLTLDGANYRLVSAQEYELTLRSDEPILYVYYQAKSVTISYIPLLLNYSAANFGSVSPRSETVTNAEGIRGSTPTAGEGFRFVGWFEDPACTKPVSSPAEADGTWKPVGMPDSNVFYYALFEPLLGNLTISKTGAETEDAACTFFFSVVGTPGTVTEGINRTVSVIGNGSVTLVGLPVGTYTVKEKSEWSWRYDPVGTGEQTAKVEANLTATAVFENRRNGSAWLGGENYCKNNFQ